MITALDILGLRPVRVEALTSDIPWSRQPRTFVIATEEGTRLKVRISRSAAWAARAALLAERLADAHVVVPLGRVGRVTLEPWVDGAPLSSTAPTDQHVRAAAQLLRRVHRFGGLERERLPRLCRVDRLRGDVYRQLNELVAGHLIEAAESSRLGRIVERLPAVAPWGLMHGDLCGANLVVRPNGDLVSIDNEHLRRGFLDYDLARTWYRWSLSAPAEASFAYHYEHRRPLRRTEQRQAWRAVATIKGLHLRYRRGAPLEWPLAALSAVLTSGER